MKKILLYEKNDHLLKIQSLILATKGYDVTPTSDIDSFLTHYFEDSAMIVVLNINDFLLLKQLFSLSFKYKNFVIIASDGILKESRKIGIEFENFLVKPFKTKSFLAKIEELSNKMVTAGIASDEFLLDESLLYGAQTSARATLSR